MKNKEIEKLAKIINDNFKYYCKCGHSVVIVRKDKKLCTHCGRYVFKNKQDEFRYRLNLTLNK